MALATCAGLATTLGVPTGTDDVYIMLSNEPTGECVRADTVLVSLPGGGIGIQPYTSQGDEKLDAVSVTV